MPRKLRFQSWSEPRYLQEGKSTSELPYWADRIQNGLDSGQSYESWRSSTIYRVPNDLRDVHAKAFDPKTVSIGPFHYPQRREKLQAMEEHKVRFLVRLLGGKLEKSSCGETAEALGREESVSYQDDKHNPASSSVSLKDLVDAMKKLEGETRVCYSERFDDIDKEGFVEMMVMDGCFVVELLRLYHEYDQLNQKKEQGKNGVGKGNRSENEPLFKMAWMIRTLQHDLLMLENQLPFFVLEKLFNLTKKAEGQTEPVPLEHLAVTFFNPLLQRREAASMLPQRNGEHEQTDYAHLLSIFRSTFLKDVRQKVGKEKGGTPQSNHKGSIRIPICNRLLKHFALENEEQNDEEQGPEESNHNRNTRTPTERQLLHFASELQERGVKFEEGKQGSDLLDVQFEESTLKMPLLSINDNTLLLFLNFLAYEQCDELPKPFFTNYFVFLDYLVGSPEDVKFLRESRILNHIFGSDKNVAKLLHKLCRQLVYVAQHSYLRHEVKQVNDCCTPYDNSLILRNWRDMIHKYFTNPWTFLSVLAAVIALGLTLMQTVFTVYPYYHPK